MEVEVDSNPAVEIFQVDLEEEMMKRIAVTEDGAAILPLDAQTLDFLHVKIAEFEIVKEQGVDAA